jgi:hypothetical protein
MTMMDDKYKVKFARYVADLADEKPDDEEVPEYFVENELRKWINDKFLLDPPIPSKTFNRKLLPKDIDNTDETLTEQKLSKKELFQDMVNEKLEYIKKRCVDADDVTFPNDISFSTCDTVDLVDSITVAELNVMSSARTDMSGELYNVTPSIYIKLIINFSSAKKIFDFDDLVYDIKHMLRKSTGGLMVVFDYTVNNTFKD